MEKIYTKNGADPQAPYSQGMISGNLIFTAGQVALLPGTAEHIGKNVSEEAEQVCKNLKAILEAAGSDCAHVIKATCFLTNMNDFAEFNKVYEKYFPHHPARTCVSVVALPLGFHCEVEVIAEKKA